MLAGANDLVRTRMYRSAREIWNGFTKNMYLGARGNRIALVGGLAGLACVSPLPELLAVRALARGRRREAALMIAAIALTTGAAEIGMRRSGFRAGSGLWLPLGLATTVAIVLNSTRRYAGGRGVSWRGRLYRGGTR
jgi:chlorobactene glucosyltransferase